MRRALLIAAGAACLAPAPLALGAPASSGPNVYIVDNAFVRNVQRPVVKVHRGETVTWHWRSRQSHSVSTRSGPERFATKTRNRGSFHHRFIKPGVYRIECSLHAPGMKMTVKVER